ncbi:MAG: xanthine dehydrogenase family protein subunit M [Streptosporangiales bacterium]|nr:xanthine dehydrogenase family protein subunit M [Streptosporangiales bacterium]
MPAADVSFSVPTSLEEALAELAEEDAIALGGGTSVGLLLKNGLIEPQKIVWLAKVPDLRGVAVDDDGGLRIGAAVTLRELAGSSPVRTHAPALADAAGTVGNPRVRAVATLGGALAHADPRQDVPPVLLALDAEVRIAAPSGERIVPLAEFYTAFMETALAEGELVTQVVVPAADNRRTHYVRFTPGSEDDYPTVGVAISIARGADGRISRAVLALGGVGPTPLLVPQARELVGRSAPDPGEISAVAAAAEAAARPSDDQRGSARYKKAMARVWTERALHACLGEG